MDNNKNQIAYMDKACEVTETEDGQSIGVEGMSTEEKTTLINELKKELIKQNAKTLVLYKKIESLTGNTVPKAVDEIPSLCEITGTKHKQLAEDIVNRATDAICGREEFREKAIIVMASLIEQQPKDAHEARLCAQAVALYSQGLKYMYRSEQGNMIPQCEFYIKNAMKLLRLHNETVEAINKHRRGGGQRVVVQHVQVNDGGQAVVNGSFEGEGEIKKLARYLMDTLPTCKAQSKQSGLRCKNFASKGKSACRIHGGRSTGAKTAEGKHSQKAASQTHGMRSKEAHVEALQVRELIKRSKHGTMINCHGHLY